MKRRTFLGFMGAAAGAAALPLRSQAISPKGRVTLLHTNDTHSHIEPFDASSGPLAGRGGMARRGALVKQLRRQLPNVLLLDAGDVFQGTPYFNQFKGRLDYKLMSLVGYDAVTLGNHDFDNGVESLVEAMEEARFPFVNCNLDARQAPALAKRLSPWIVKDLPGIRVGITGVCVAFEGLVAPKNHAGVVWHDPLVCLPPVVKHLREVERVDMVVVLSHLGHDAPDAILDDQKLAARVMGIDAIIGGHSHTFLDAPVKVGDTHIFQVGWGGVNLGRMDFHLEAGVVQHVRSESLPLLESSTPRSA